MLADIARHVANALRDEEGAEVRETLSQIQRIFNAELDEPAEEPTGSFVE